MTWVRLDDKLPRHPKVMALGKLRHPALGVHVEALCYCSEYLTDGILPAEYVRRCQRRLVEALVSVGIRHRLGDGTVQVHDYLDYNPSREAVNAKRTEARVRMNILRTSREPADSRARASRTHPVPEPHGSTSPLTFTTRASRGPVEPVA